MQFTLDHIALNVTDMEGMLAFYTEVLRLPEERVDAFRRGEVPFPSVRLTADTIIDLFPPAMWRDEAAEPPQRQVLNHFCLTCATPQWQELHRRLAEQGVEIEEGPVPRWGAHGTGISIYFRDPEGNRIELRHYDQQQDDLDSCRLGS